MNKEPLFIWMASVRKMWEWRGGKADPIWDRMGKYFLPECISKLFRRHRQQTYDNIWAERAKQHIKAAPADTEGFG